MKNPFIKNCILCVLSAGLLILAFPKTGISILAWIALVPMLLAIEGKGLLKSFGIAYFCGVLFFAGALYWFYYVTVAGLILMVLYCALYFGLFGFMCSYFKTRKPLLKLFLIPSIWVALEFLRAHLVTGFGWASLGQSQYKNLYVIQIADLTGMWGVSFVIVMFNVLIKEWFSVPMERGNQSIINSSVKREQTNLTLITCLVLVSVFIYGYIRVSEDEKAQAKIKVAVIQGNIDQEMKWNDSFWPAIMARQIKITEEAALQKPDLIIWPETSFPGYLWVDVKLFDELKEFVRRMDIPLLFGSIIEEGEIYRNSAILLSREGHILQKYDKIHLVPFGEFLPFRTKLPFLSEIIPIADFSSGDQFTLFSLAEAESASKFSVLICFEDTIAGLTRQFVNEGAQILINITNDAWFEDTNEPFMHLASSVFRAVENRRHLIRSANTGISGFIDTKGRLGEYVVDERGKSTYVSGYAIEELSYKNKQTFYTRFGDIFTYLSFGCILFSILGNLKSKKNK